MFKKHDILIILEVLGIVLLCIIPQFNAGAVATYLIILATCACILLWLLIENHTRKYACTWCVIGCVLFYLLALRFDILYRSIIGMIFVIIYQFVSFVIIINKEDDND